MTLLFLGMAVLGYSIFKLSDMKKGGGVSRDYIKLDALFGLLIGLIVILQSVLDYYLKSETKYLWKALVLTINFSILYFVSRVNNLIYIRDENGYKLRDGWLFIAFILVLPSIVATILI